MSRPLHQCEIDRGYDGFGRSIYSSSEIEAAKALFSKIPAAMIPKVKASAKILYERPPARIIDPERAMDDIERAFKNEAAGNWASELRSIRGGLAVLFSSEDETNYVIYP